MILYCEIKQTLVFIVGDRARATQPALGPR
jgi:hypothetical protein